MLSMNECQAINNFQNYLDSIETYYKRQFSVAKATLHSQMSVRSSVCQSQKPLNSLKSSSFIIHPSSFIIHPSTLIILHSSFLHFATFKLFSLLLCIRQEWSLYRDLSSITVIVSSNLFSGVQPPRMAANYPERRSCKTSSIERVRDKVEDQSPKKHFSIT